MSVIELGSLAGAMIAVITLITKMISLITSIQNLINRLDTMQSEIQSSQHGLRDLSTRVNAHDSRIQRLETDFRKMEESVEDYVDYAFG